MIIKRWHESNKALEQYNPYHILNYGLSWVKPQDIYALSLPLKTVRCDKKSQRLKASVIANGWNDQYPSDLHLCRLPNGLFVVASGGNHRAYLANQLKIPLIQAYVSILLPNKFVSKGTIESVENYSNKLNNLISKVQEINELESKADIRDIRSLHNEKMKYLGVIEELEGIRQHLLFTTAESLGYMKF